MPGPGGGSRGGGFGGGSRGGSFGGGSRPGGFGGHYHHHHHRPYGFGFFPFFGFRRPYYGYGGGCLGGLMGMMFMPIIILIVAFSLLINVVGSVGSSISNVANGGQIAYNESRLQDYADNQYAIEFRNANEYEDNILVVFLIDESRDGYYTIAWVGDNIADDIYSMFGNEYTEFGRIMKGSIAANYENSLSRNLSFMVNGMADEIDNLRLSSSFITNNGSPAGYKSHLTNNSSLAMNEETVNDALEKFTLETDIPFVIVVEDMEEVFDKNIRSIDIMTIILAVGLSGVAIYFIYRAFKDKKEENREEV